MLQMADDVMDLAAIHNHNQQIIYLTLNTSDTQCPDTEILGI